MGLDVTAYKHVRLVKPRPPEGYDDEDLDRDGATSFYVVPAFAAAADGLVTGLYETSSDAHSFRAGSYGGYNAWRRMLAALVGVTTKSVWKDPQPGPFVELINNADNEGVIGPVTSAKLARDFAEWQERADAYVPDTGVHGDADEMGDYFRRAYANWRKAFELAAGEGAVKLH